MMELIETFDLDGNYLNAVERRKFYKEIYEEFAKKGKITRKIKSIRVLLMNSSGRIYLQKRSKIKEENKGLYDKTVGGHVRKGDSFEVSVVRECAEELGFPAAVISEEEFNNTIKTVDLDIVGLFRKVEYLDEFNSERISKEGKKIIQPFMTSIYIGYFDGPIKFVDGESSGIEVFSLNELKDELKKFPEKFTQDTKFMIKKYEKFLKPLRH